MQIQNTKASIPELCELINSQLKVIKNVLPEELFNQAVLEIEALPTPELGRNPYRCNLFGSYAPVEVHYTSSHEIDETKSGPLYRLITSEQAQTDSIKRMVLVALNQFGQELKLEGIQNIQYHLTRFILPKNTPTDSLAWHTDPNNGWSMVYMLSDPSKWTGGSLQIAAHKASFQKLPSLLDIYQPIEGTIRSIPYTKNGAVLFDNQYIVHKPEPMEAREFTHRHILVVFQDPT